MPPTIATQPSYATLDDWIAREAISFPLDASATFATAVDEVLALLGDSVQLLGFGEALHGSEEILLLRNRLFQHLVEAQGYRSIAVESSFPRGRVVNEYITGRGPASPDEVWEKGFSHAFGRVEANRELVEWMRAYNADPAHPTKLRFYGFDLPGGYGGPSSPRQVLSFVLDYLATMDRGSSDQFRARIEALIGEDARWENPMAWRDPVQSAPLLSDTAALRNETEDLLSQLRTHRPEYLARGGAECYLDAEHECALARNLLTFYVVLARDPGYAGSLGVRDALMADNLAYLVSREQARGKVFTFAHNAHLQRGKISIPMGPQVCAWWPAGAHLHEFLGARYAVIGSALGVSPDNGIAPPEAGTLEARLTATPGPARFIPTHRGHGLPDAEIAALPTRTRGTRNPSYTPLTPQSFSDFDAWAVLDTTSYPRGAMPLPG